LKIGKAMIVYTIGHGTRTTEELVEILRAAGVSRLIDVRRFPASRRNPHLAREELERSLPEHSVVYEWWGDELGGRRSGEPLRSRHPAWKVEGFRAYADYMDTEQFRTALGRLEEQARGGHPLAIMCAETLWWRCHRRLISDALVADGFEVVHLVERDERQPHSLAEFARIDERGRPVYDVGVDRELPL
jgi:uncharacterized protein (DUF488 family)